ncbi:MAG: fused MFS/spermidine synthase [Candidatus Zixiibacteriota bacterium]
MTTRESPAITNTAVVDDASRVSAALYALAFLSGIAALLYQVVWVHMLTLTFGSTTAGAGVAIASFMAGLGLGARAYELLRLRVANALRLYAGIEFGIAVLAVVVSAGLYRLPTVYAELAQFIDGTLALTVVRLSLSFGSLLLPSFLIGATFPALCTAVIRTRSGVPRHLGGLYGINTLGAAVGTVLAGFVLVEQLGNLSTVGVAAAINGGVGLIALLLSRRTAGPSAPGPFGTPYGTSVTRFAPGHIAAALAVSGFTTMSFEIVWMRGLKYLIGNSTYAMSLVLAVFLVGLALGGLLYRPLVRRLTSDAILTVSLVVSSALALAGVAGLALVLSHESLAGAFSIFSPDVRFLPWPQRLLLTSSISIFLMLPATVAMGIIFPVASSLLIDRIEVLGRKVGSAYFYSTLGSIAGILLAALVIVPQLGVTGGTRLIALLSLITGIVLAIRLRPAAVSSRSLLAGGVVTAVALIAVLPSPMPFAGEQEEGSDRRVIFWEEGEQSTVKVIERGSDGARAMTVDGYLIGVSADWRREAAYKQIILAHLPMALRPNAGRTLNIGLGSATTLASLSRYPTIRTLDCVEISESVVAGAHTFDDGRVLDDPRAHVIVDDAVHYLRRTDARYDVIISDGKQNPQFPGNATLLAREFYELSLARMTHDGVFVQWIPANLPVSAFRMVLKTFVESFPHSVACYFPPSCIILAGSRQSLDDYDTGDGGIVELPAWARAELEPYHIDSRELLLASRVCSGHSLLPALEDAGINTWDHPSLEFIPYKEWEAGKNLLYSYENIGLLVVTGIAEAQSGMTIPSDLRPAFVSSSIMRVGFVELMRTLTPDSLRPYCERALAINPADSVASAALHNIPDGLAALMIPGS